MGLAFLLALNGVAGAFTLEDHHLCRRVLSNDCIVVEAGGLTAIPMPAVRALLAEDDLLTAVQEEYVRLQSNAPPEFVIQRTGPSQYHYVNRKGQETEITEVFRMAATDGQSVRMALYSKGRRFFGEFQTLIDITVNETDEAGQSAYAVTVYAYPEHAISRFFIRHLGIVESFFRDKTREIETLSNAICNSLYARKYVPNATR